MNKQAVQRWTVLGTALAATVAAIFYPVEEESVVAVAERPAGAKAVAAKQVLVAAAEAPPQWLAADSDPFAPRGWVAPPPVPVAPPPAVAAAMAAEAPPAPPPPLPYKFVGQMRDGSNTVVYLSLGDQMVLARSGEVLDGGYKVTAISPSQIEFESVALGVHQTLPIPVQD
ncbi:hypothetical protein [Pseudoduganella rhizocola]|uniref:hypothetical protein n=1 Tax=Pseudoduganella rhizocola TaxID=3382643 RepID=UPI0038B544D9